MEFLGRIGLGLVFGCMSPVDMICISMRALSDGVMLACLRVFVEEKLGIS